MYKMHRHRGPKIQDIIQHVPPHPYMLLYAATPIDEVRARLVEIEIVRNIYVLNSKGQLIGYLSLGRLIRYFTTMRRRSGLHYHSLLEFVSARTVQDLMEEDVVFARMGDYAQEVLDKMIAREIKEVPVIDGSRRVVGNIGILDLWRHTEGL